jgi:nicotinate phosphoribosyltransferase
VYRHRLESGEFATDVLTLDTDPQPGEPLLEGVMRGGQVVAPVPLTTSREHARAQLAALPAELRALDHHADYHVEISRALVTLTERVDKEFR